MMYILKRYWKFIVFFISVVIVSTISYFYFDDNNEVTTVSENKLSIEKVEKDIQNEKQEEIKKTIFVDVKGYVNNPGVYEVDENKRVIDAINLAGGLKGNAITSNLNLSKKLTDEMLIIVYSKQEINTYMSKLEKENVEIKEISCVNTECICPDIKNDACINKEEINIEDEQAKEEKTEQKNDKISINNATKEELMTLDGIGESKANNIIKYRQENKFNTIEDIKNVSGIGDAAFEKIKDKITL